MSVLAVHARDRALYNHRHCQEATTMMTPGFPRGQNHFPHRISPQRRNANNSINGTKLRMYENELVSLAKA